jgi:hypothetical protein
MSVEATAGAEAGNRNNGHLESNYLLIQVLDVWSVSVLVVTVL